MGETKRAEKFLVGPEKGQLEKKKENCKTVVCMHRNGRIGLKPSEPPTWTEEEFLEAFEKRCIGEYKVKADQIICGFKINN